MTTASFNRIPAASHLSAAFELWKFDALTDPAAARTQRPAPKEPDPTAALNALREAAKTQGYEAGLAAGKLAGQRQIEQEAAKLRALCNAFNSCLGNLQQDVGEALLGLALDVARQVMRTELTQQPEALLPMIREALELSGSAQQGQLLLNPADMDLVRTHLHELLTAGQWRVLEDSSIESGGCRVTTASGSIDATLATRWKRVASSLGSSDAW